ncbi:dienelactone hydrolase family protein [Reinekea blandensis]|uniref:Putative carboxymethylenebutenolidase n=1 Tax=Reinekea blandensis MED297 TaxID=314283 RepID=A4BGZ5_9GAMM|nr:dienelactone hydrolase family protein [Reinekea blandensis]EAR08641.1 Putative carboxymethylenebutenolidase [Reinekea sp. MED297] [Reinekea blandensis MED297]
MNIKLKAKDGHAFDCWVQAAEGKAIGGLVIVQEIFGVTDQLIAVAKQYAKQGLNVAIPALFDRQQPGTVVPFDQASIGLHLMQDAKVDENLADIRASVEELSKGGLDVAVMGFCWGGGLAVRCAQVLDIRCAVSFYGTRLSNYMNQPLAVPVQGHFGDQDDHVPEALLNEFKALYPQAEIFVYEAGHAFANESRPSYVKDAAELAHERTIRFIKKHLTESV